MSGRDESARLGRREIAGARRGGSERPRAGEHTRERIFDGAVRAVARHGLSKLGMSDVSSSAGVSRATLYRYFPTREQLLDGLAAREASRFLARVLEALGRAPAGEQRLGVVVEYATKHVREHPALQVGERNRLARLVRQREIGGGADHRQAARGLCPVAPCLCAGTGEKRREKPAPDHAFSSFFSSSRKRKFAPSARILSGLALIMPPSRSRRE